MASSKIKNQQMRAKLASYAIYSNSDLYIWLSANDLRDMSIWGLGEALFGANNAHRLYQEDFWNS